MRRINHSSRFIEITKSERTQHHALNKLTSIERKNVNPIRGTIYTLYSFPAYDNNRIPEVIDGGDIKSSKLLLTSNTVLYNKLNVRLRRVWNIKELKTNNNICSSEFIPLKVNKDVVLQEYLMYCLTSDTVTEMMESASQGTSNSQQRISPSSLMQVSIPVIPKNEQKHFIELYQQSDKSKFSDFKSRFIEMFGSLEKTKPLSECIGTTFPGEWGEDDLDGSGVNVIRTTNFTNSGKLDLTNVVTRKIDQAKIDKKHLAPGDIILERSGGTADNPVGRVVYFEADGIFLFNNFTQLLRCKDGVNSLFVFYSLFNYYHTHKNEIRSMGNKTTGIQNLKMDKYWDIPIADASPEQQEQFVCLYNQADKSKYLN